MLNPSFLYVGAPYDSSTRPKMLRMKVKYIMGLPQKPMQ